MESMRSQTISKEALSNLKDWRADCRCMKEAFLKESTHESDPMIKTFYKSIAASFVNAELISSWVELSLVSINDLGRTINKLSSNQKLHSTRKESSDSKKRKTGMSEKALKRSKTK